MPTLNQFRYSFPLRLFALHFRNHLILIGLWVLLGFMTTGLAGRFFGMHYLLLTPEYRGEVGFSSFLLTGAAFGALTMIWHLTTYLLCANRFPFLATLRAPFTQFSFNNSVIPLCYMVAYLTATIWFQWHDELITKGDIVWHVFAFLLGGVSFILFLAGYMHLTNKDMASFLRAGKFVPKPGGRLLVPGQRMPTLAEIRAGSTRWRVDTYMSMRGHVRLVRSVAHYDPDLLARVFRQNHFNAVAVQIAVMGLLLIQGCFMEVEWLRFPTSVSIFILASMVMSIFGAITFWFRQWGTMVFFILVVLINGLTSKGYFHYRNHAYGLKYGPKSEWPEYNYATLEQMAGDSVRRIDEAATQQILDQWLARRKEQFPKKKPKIVLICASGGGLRAGLWALRALQKADAGTGGRLLRHTVLMSGASGGMLGLGYLREMMLRQSEGDRVSVHDSTMMDDLGKDLLNPVTFAMVSNDLFYPTSTFNYAGERYLKDRGYLFEQQLNENLRSYMGRRLGDYQAPEADATIPMMILSPFIINDNRRLLISPQGMSYMMRPPDEGRYTLSPEIDGIDFRRMFAAQQADSLAFTTALRMNSTFPYILPNTWLPSRPSLEIMDAGTRDNFGILTLTRFVHVFRHWISANTSGVVIVQVSGWEKHKPISTSDEKGIIDGLFTPAGTAVNMTLTQDFDQDNTLSLLHDLLGNNQLEVVRFTYKPVRKQREASLSWHLSKRERLDIREAWYLEANQKSLLQLKRALE